MKNPFDALKIANTMASAAHKKVNKPKEGSPEEEVTENSKEEAAEGAPKKKLNGKQIAAIKGKSKA